MFCSPPPPLKSTTENRECVVEGRGFFSTRINLFGMPEEHIIRTYYRLPSHVILNLLQEIKDNMEPSTNFLQPFIGLRCFSTHCGLFSWDFTVRIFTCIIHGPEVTDENISKSPGSSSKKLNDCVLNT